LELERGLRLIRCRKVCGLVAKIDNVEVDDIFGYDKLVAAEKATLQKGMNYRVGKDYSVFLMSLRENAPHADALDEVTGMLRYEGHDESGRQGGPGPKRSRSAINDAERIVDRKRLLMRGVESTT